MAEQSCSKVVTLSDYINVTDYYVYEGPCGRLSAAYKMTGANITEVPNPGTCT